jgi:competence protein ComFC
MFFNNIKNYLLDLFFPKTCFGCFKEGFYLCEKCKSTLFFDADSNDSFKNSYFDNLFACFKYVKGSLIQKLIIQFKYKYSKDLTDLLGNFLLKKIQTLNLNLKTHFFIPVPISKKRLKMRGFNQTKLLCDYLAQNLSKSHVLDCLYRKKNVTSQAKLNKKGRMENLKDVIGIKPEFVQSLNGKTVFLIDDVVTTGSTLNECSKVLKQNGVKLINCFVLAKRDLLNFNKLD